MRKRPRHLLVAVLAMLGMLLAACGDDGGDTGGDGGDGGGSPSATGGAPTGGGEELGGSVSVAAVWSGPEEESFKAVLDAFTEQTGVETSYKSTGDDIATYLGSQLSGGNPPDVAILPQPGLLRDLASDQNLKPIGTEAEQNLSANFAPYWTDLATVDGQQLGVYWKASNKSTWWYMKSAFETAGVQPPKTWEDLESTADTVVASGLPFVAIGGADGWPLTDWFENIYLRTAGAEKYDQLTEHQIPWTDPSVTEALQVFTDLIKRSGVVLGDASGALQTTFDDSINQVLTGEPQAATTFEGDFVPGGREDTGVKAGDDFDFFDFPSINDSGPSVVGGGDVAVTMTGTPQAQALLAYLATPEAAEVWAQRGGFTSPNKNLDPSVYPDDITRRSAEAVVSAAGAGNFRFDMSDLAPPAFGGTAGRGLWGELQDILRNPDDISAVQQQLEKAASAAYK